MDLAVLVHSADWYQSATCRTNLHDAMRSDFSGTFCPRFLLGENYDPMALNYLFLVMIGQMISSLVAEEFSNVVSVCIETPFISDDVVHFAPF